MSLCDSDSCSWLAISSAAGATVLSRKAEAAGLCLELLAEEAQRCQHERCGLFCMQLPSQTFLVLLHQLSTDMQTGCGSSLRSSEAMEKLV